MRWTADAELKRNMTGASRSRRGSSLSVAVDDLWTSMRLGERRCMWSKGSWTRPRSNPQGRARRAATRIANRRRAHGDDGRAVAGGVETQLCFNSGCWGCVSCLSSRSSASLGGRVRVWAENMAEMPRWRGAMTRRGDGVEGSTTRSRRRRCPRGGGPTRRCARRGGVRHWCRSRRARRNGSTC